MKKTGKASSPWRFFLSACWAGWDWPAGWDNSAAENSEANAPKKRSIKTPSLPERPPSPRPKLVPLARKSAGMGGKLSATSATFAAMPSLLKSKLASTEKLLPGRKAKAATAAPSGNSQS